MKRPRLTMLPLSALALCGVLLALTVRVPDIHAAGAPRAGTAPPACAASPLGPATDFNLFVLGDLAQSNSDTEGRLAAGGNVSLTNYSIGGSLASSPAGGDSLAVGGTLDFRQGDVRGGNAVSRGPGTVANVTFAPGYGYRQGQTLDFGTAAATLRASTARYAALPANGTTIFRYNQLTLSGSDPRLNVFAVAAADLAVANSVTVNAPAGSTALLNIGGTAAQMRYQGYGLNGVDRAHVLYNFPQATSLTLDGVGIEGSILAPFAAVQFTNGAINGQLVGGSLAGPGQANRVPFAGCLPPETTGSPTATPTGTATPGCLQFQAIFTVSGATFDMVTLTAGPTPQRTSLPVGTTVYYRVLDPSTGTALGDVRSVVVTRSPAGFGTFTVPLPISRPTSDPQGRYTAEVSSDPQFPNVTTPLGSCTVRNTFTLPA